MATTEEKVDAAEQFVQDHFDDALVDFSDVDIHDLLDLYEGPVVHVSHERIEKSWRTRV
jgi:hypothetical protein